MLQAAILKTAAKVDEEIVNSCLNKSIDLLKTKGSIGQTKQDSIRKETITGTEFIKLLKQENIHVTPEDVKINREIKGLVDSPFNNSQRCFYRSMYGYNIIC